VVTNAKRSRRMTSRGGGAAKHVCGVKSLPAAGTDDRQLRLGVGQVLDYQALMARRHDRVRAILARERAPSDLRWALVCDARGIVLVWPETFSVLLHRETQVHIHTWSSMEASADVSERNGTHANPPPWVVLGSEGRIDCRRDQDSAFGTRRVESSRPDQHFPRVAATSTSRRRVPAR
jgi:hypothetical protein